MFIPKEKTTHYDWSIPMWEIQYLRPDYHKKKDDKQQTVDTKFDYFER